MRLTSKGTNEKKCKTRSKGFGKGSRDLLLKFWDPLHIFGMVWARNFNFGIQIDHQKNAKLGQSGQEGVTWPTFEILGLFHISGTAWASNFEFGKQIDHEVTTEKNTKIAQRGLGRNNVTYFWNFETPPYLESGWSWELQNWHAFWTPAALWKKCKIWSKGVAKVSLDLTEVLSPKPKPGVDF